MTARQLERRVGTWQRRLALLGIAHWRFTVALVDQVKPGDEPISPDDIMGRATVGDLYDSVEFEFKRSGLEGKTDRELDELVVHEWLHVADRDRDEAEQALMETLGSQAADAWEDRLWRLREAQVERLARLIVLPYH